MNSSLYDIKWPPKPEIKPFKRRVITTEQELNSFLDECVAAETFSFDYETGPDYATYLKHATDTDVYKHKLKELIDDYNIHVQMAKGAMAIKAAAKVLKQREVELTELYANQTAWFKEAAFDPHRSDICAVSMCCNVEECAVVFLLNKGKRTFLDGTNFNMEERRELLFYTLKSRIFNNRNVVKVAYNLEFEAMHSLKHGAYILTPVFDPFIAVVRCMQVVKWDEIIDAKKPSSGKGLKDMARQWLGVEMTKFEELLTTKNVEFFNQLSSDDPDAEKYSAEDAIYSLYLAEYWSEVASLIPIENSSSPYSTYCDWLCNIEMPFMRVIGEMRYHGFTWDQLECERIYKYALEMQELTNAKITEICNRICDKIVASGIPETHVALFRNINAGKTGKTGIVKTLLFDILQAPVASTSKLTNDPSLDKESMLDMIFMVEHNLKSLKEEELLSIELPEDFSKMNAIQIKAYDVKHRPDAMFKTELLELLTAITDMQKYGTLISSHIEGRSKYQHPITGRIHSSYTVWTETSRTNSSRPNGQNVPRPDNDPLKIRSLYRAAKGKILILIDYAGFELRLMAWKSNDETMLTALNKGWDLHRMTGSAMTGKKQEDVTKHERSLAKAGNFGINYGGTEHSLQSTLKTMNIRISLGECLKIVNAIKATYPGIPQFQKDVALKARQQRFVDTIYGFKRVLNDINSSRRDLRSSDERRAANTPIQGSAADIMKRSQNAMYEYIGEHNLHSKVNMIAQIHDEVILEIDENYAVESDVVSDIVEIMERPPLKDFPVPMLVDVSASSGSWSDKASWKDWKEKNGKTTNK